MMAAFADQAALAWQLATTQRQMRELDILTDRDRIARDLHDHVIQRLFAVGLALQGTIPRARSTEVQQRLTDCVDELQQVIQEIRTAIFDLHGGSSDVTRLRQRLDDAIAQSRAPSCILVRFSARCRSLTRRWLIRPKPLSRRRLRCRSHATATTLAVTVAVGDEVCIELVDDGPGAPAGLADGAIADLRSRTEDAGG